MAVPDLLEPIEPLVRQLKSFSEPAYSTFSEEEQSAPPNFAEECLIEPIEDPESETRLVDVEKIEEELMFEAFLDGVQRTILWRRVPLSKGALVPIHIAHIGAGLVLRDNSDGRLYMEPRLVAGRLLLLGPFEGLRRAGVKLGDMSCSSQGVMLDTDDRTFGFPERLNEWVLCDTTFRGTESDRENHTEGALIGDALLNEGLVRSRAQGRVATLRQRLEFAVLARFRRGNPESWVLVDGPLFFIDKWRRRAVKLVGPEVGEHNESFLEDKLLYNAVGLIKSQRLRPKDPGRILGIGPKQRSQVFRLSEEVDMKGRRDASDDSRGIYGSVHLTWYTRLRCRSEPPYGLLGLIRLDVHRATIHEKSGDALNPESFEKHRPLINSITGAVWRERWPAFRRTDDYRSAAEPYPIQQVEQALKAVTLPRRFLARITI